MEPAPLHLVLGDEALLVDRAVDGAVAAAFDGGAPGFNLAAFTVGEGDAREALAVARTMPMMARRRVVVLRGVQKADSSLLDELLAYAANPNPSTVLLIVGSRLPARNEAGDRGARLEKAVRERGRVEKFEAGEVSPASFARAHAESLGCRLDSRAAALMVELAGADLGRIRAEVDKAAAYVGGAGPIGPEVVEATCSMVAEAVVWELTDAVLRRDADRGMAAAYRMLEQGGDSDGASHRLLAMITWQVRQLLELQYADRTRNPLPGSWMRAPQSKLRSAREALRRHPLAAAHILGALARANRGLNRSRAGDRRVFEALVLELTSA